jgi:hypothetical protein
LKKKLILDPLWITKGSYLDPEYFNYILLAASKKFREDIEEGSLEHFYELIFHNLNLNTLAVDGALHNSKLHPILKSERIKLIADELKQIFSKKEEVVEIFRNANYVFLNLLLDYMEVQLDALENINFFFMNQCIHEESEIFIITTSTGSNKYQVWKLSIDLKKDLGYSIKKIKRLILSDLGENALRNELDKNQDEDLLKIKEDKNLIFAISDGPYEKITTNIIKDIILLNRGIAKGITFEPNIINELYNLLMAENLMPFTLNQWTK